MSRQHIEERFDEFFSDTVTPVVKNAFIDHLLEGVEIEYIVTDRTGGIHRGPWDKETAEAWVAECDDMGFKPGTFWVQEIITIGVPPQVEEPFLEI